MKLPDAVFAANVAGLNKPVKPKAKVIVNNKPELEFLAKRLLELDAQGEAYVMPFYDALPPEIAEQALILANELNK